MSGTSTGHVFTNSIVCLFNLPLAVLPRLDKFLGGWGGLGNKFVKCRLLGDGSYLNEVCCLKL